MIAYKTAAFRFLQFKNNRICKCSEKYHDIFIFSGKGNIKMRKKGVFHILCSNKKEEKSNDGI